MWKYFRSGSQDSSWMNMQQELRFGISFAFTIIFTSNIGLMMMVVVGNQVMMMMMIQVHDDLGQLDCAKSPTTMGREGAAAGFFQPADSSGICLGFVCF